MSPIRPTTRAALARFASVAALVALVPTLAACEREDGASSEVVIVTPSPGSAAPDTSASGTTRPATEGPAPGTITLDAITPGPLPGDGDAFCVAIVSAITDYNAALGTYTNDLLAAIGTAATTNDLTPINDLGATVNRMAIEATDRMDDALELTDNKAARDGITGMIEYLEVYLTPVALIMMASSTYASLNDDITAHTQAQLPVIGRQSGHARTVEDYTYERCGVDLKVLTAG